MLPSRPNTRAACGNVACTSEAHAYAPNVERARDWHAVKVRDHERAVRRWHELLGGSEQPWDVLDVDAWERVVRDGPRGWRVELVGYWAYLRRRRAAVYYGKPYREQRLRGLRKGL